MFVSETENSNPVIYTELHILPIFSPYDAIIMSVLSVKFCQPGFPACDIRFYRFCSQEHNISHIIYYFETRQSFALVISLNGWLKNLKSLSIRSFQIPKFKTRTSLFTKVYPKSKKIKSNSLTLRFLCGWEFVKHHICSQVKGLFHTNLFRISRTYTLQWNYKTKV